MVRSLLLGSLLGLFSGVVPGPFSALVAATALKRGFMAGFWIAVVPLMSEVVVMGLTAVFLSRLPDQALRLMGLAGGILVFFLAWRTWGEAEETPEAEALKGSRWRMMEGALLAILSPAPWAFWLLVGSPLFLAAYHEGWGTAAAFLGSFLFFLVGVHLTVAGMAAYGRKVVSLVWHKRLMRGAAVALALAGSVLLWQSWVGNFHRMVSGSQALQSIVDSLPPR